MFSHDCLLSQRVSDHMKHFLFPLRGIHYNHILIMYCIIYTLLIWYGIYERIQYYKYHCTCK